MWSLVHKVAPNPTRLLINMSDLLLLREMNSFWVVEKKQKACLPAHSEQIRCHQLVPPCWELLRSLSRLKRTENNGRRWIQSDVIKSRKMSLYSPVLKPFHAASYLSVSPSKKSWRNGPEYSLWCLPRIHINGGTKKPNPEFQTRLDLANVAQIFLIFIPPPSITETTERHDSL